MSTPSMNALGLDRLSVAERILLAEELWDSIAGTPEAVTLTEAQQQDLKRRLEAYRDNPKAGSPWEEVKRRLQGGDAVSLPLIVNPMAEADLAEAKAWYDERRPGLGNDFLLCVEEVFERLRRATELHGKAFQELRLALVRRFPYVVVYRADEDEVTVVAVYHSHRDPRGWQDRA